MQNGNALLCSNKSNEVLATPCPLKHLKKYVKRAVEMPTTSTSTSATKMTTDGMPKSMTTRMTAGTDTSMEARKEHVPSKKKLCFEFDMTSNTTSSLTSSSDASATSSTKEINNRSDELEFVDDILDVTGESVIQDELESLDSDDEFTVEVWSVRKAQNWPFQPLSDTSRQEVGPLVQITSFGQYPKYAVGGLCTQGKAPTVHKIKGDGNCYFHAISYSICGEERYYAAIRNAVCDFISTFNGDLKPFLTRGKGKEYIQKSKMRKNTTWASEIEILATAKILHRDVFTYHNFKWLRYPYKHKLSVDALYLDNCSGLHFDIVLHP